MKPSTVPAPENATENAPPPPAPPTGPIVHVQNRGKQQLRAGGRFVGPDQSIMLRGQAPDVHVVNAAGESLVVLPSGDLSLLADLHRAGVVWCSDPTFLTTASPVIEKPAGVSAASLSW